MSSAAALHGSHVLADPEREGIAGSLFTGLQSWLGGQEAAELAEQWYQLGRTSYCRGISVEELSAVLRAWRERTSACTPADVLDHFCDFVRFYVLRGYQDALR